jgi:nucleoside phosphorylase
MHSSLLDTKAASSKIGIITALEKEFAAVKAVLENTEDVFFEGKGAGNRYLYGEVPACNGGKHAVILALAGMGNNAAAERVALLTRHFSKIESIIMAGIAGGIPCPENAKGHVRLGDIVVSNENGVVQYDVVKETSEITEHRFSPRPPSAYLIEAVKFLKVEEIGGNRPWLQFIDQALEKGKVRPSEANDVLHDSNDPEKVISHPPDSDRQQDQPRVFLGSIASADTLLKNPIKRDELRNKFGTKAVEMEGAGIADSGWSLDVGYLVIRGICDYCDSYKNDVWQSYAAAAAAAYTRVLIESIPCFDPLPIPSPHADQDGIDPRYHPILEAFKYGSVVPFLGAGINSEAFLSLTSHLASEIREDLQRQDKWNSSESQDKELIRRLVGTPCSICHYLLEDRPDPCPMKEGMKADCPLYQEQKLTVAKTNLRCLMSQYLKSKQGDMLFYNNCEQKLENFKM